MALPVRDANAQIRAELPESTLQDLTMMLGGNPPNGFRSFDRFENGVATSIKSIDTRTTSNLNAAKLNTRLMDIIQEIRFFRGENRGVVRIRPEDITERRLQVAVPKGGVTDEQWQVFNGIIQYGQRNGVGVTVVVIP